MKKKLKKIFTSWRVIVWLIFVILAVVAIHPNFDSEGVAIRSVIKDSAANIAGIQSPKASSSPMSREVIQSIDQITITDETKFHEVMQDIYDRGPNTSFRVTTDVTTYFIKTIWWTMAACMRCKHWITV